MALKFAVNNSLSAITTLPSSISGGALNLISTQTASASASLEFSLDDSYDSYVFKFINIHPSTDGQEFQFQASTDSGTSYGVTCTSTAFFSYHNEAGSDSALTYAGGSDLAQSTSFQRLAKNTAGSDADANSSGHLVLYNPSNTTFVKHFMSNTNSLNGGYTQEEFYAGYFNTTLAVTNLKFQMSSGNIDDGIIKMYGVS